MTEKLSDEIAAAIDEGCCAKQIVQIIKDWEERIPAAPSPAPSPDAPSPAAPVPTPIALQGGSILDSLKSA